MNLLDLIFGDKELKPSGLAKHKADFDYSKLSKQDLDRIGKSHLYRGPQQPTTPKPKSEESLDEIYKSLSGLSEDPKFKKYIKSVTSNKSHVLDPTLRVGLTIPIEDSISSFPLSTYVKDISLKIMNIDTLNYNVFIEVSTSNNLILRDILYSNEIVTRFAILNRSERDSIYLRYYIKSLTTDTNLIYGSFIIQKNYQIDNILSECISNIYELFRIIRNNYVDSLRYNKTVELSNQYQRRREEAYEQFKNNFEWVEDCLIHIQDMSDKRYHIVHNLLDINAPYKRSDVNQFGMRFSFQISNINFVGGKTLKIEINETVSKLFTELTKATIRIKSRIKGCIVSTSMSDEMIVIDVAYKWEDELFLNYSDIYRAVVYNHITQQIEIRYQNIKGLPI